MDFVIAWVQTLRPQPVVDVAQFVELRLRHWLDCFCRIGVVKHRKPLRRFVWYYEDIPRPIARVVILQQVFRMDTTGNQVEAAQGDGLGIAGHVLFQVAPTVDEILPRL